MPRHDVITFGDLCVDLLVSGGDIVPRFGQAEQLVDNYGLEMGGSCAIFACQAAKLGLRTAILGRVGDDAFGHLITHQLQSCGVQISAVRVEPTLKTGLSVHLSSGDDRSILTYVGSIAALTPDHVTADLLASARHLHYGSFFLHTGLQAAAPRIMAFARRLGLSTSLDTNWDPAERWNSTLLGVLPLTDVFMPNERELFAISRCDTLEDAAEWVRDQGVPVLAVKRGAAGARVYGDDGVHDCLSESAEPGGDSVGAGDGFDAGFLAGWLRGLPARQCLQIACLCGRGVAGSIGGLRGQPTWTDINLRI
jgi:sugar/nucleoside kinase (ribokinase family)